MCKKATVFCLGMVLVVFVLGCASIQKGTTFNGLNLTAENKSNVGHYNGANWGIYLLGSIPLLTGDTDKAVEGVLLNTSFLNDSVNVDQVGGMITKAAKEDGSAVVEDLVSSRKSIWLMPTLVLFYKRVEMSANGVK